MPSTKKKREQEQQEQEQEQEQQQEQSLPQQQEQQEQQQEQEPEIITPSGEFIASHDDLLQQARRNRAAKEAGIRLNRIHEYEMQIKSQQDRDPNVTLRDQHDNTWEDYHDTFWKVKRGLLYADDPEGLNRFLAKLIGEEKEISWMNEYMVEEKRRRTSR